MRGIAGSMFSGKTDELIRQTRRAEFAGKKVAMFKPKVDNRWGLKDKVKSHSGAEHPAIEISHSGEIESNVTAEIDVVAIDEIQFLDQGVVDVVKRLLDLDIEVIFGGLPLDFRGEPFGPMPILLALSDEITRLTAICTHRDNGDICGEPATRTQRLLGGKPANYHDPIIMIGAENEYAPRCPRHHFVPGKP